MPKHYPHDIPKPLYVLRLGALLVLTLISLVFVRAVIRSKKLLGQVYVAFWFTASVAHNTNTVLLALSLS